MPVLPWASRCNHPFFYACLLTLHTCKRNRWATSLLRRRQYAFVRPYILRMTPLLLLFLLRVFICSSSPSTCGQIIHSVQKGGDLSVVCVVAMAAYFGKARPGKPLFCLCVRQHASVCIRAAKLIRKKHLTSSYRLLQCPNCWRLHFSPPFMMKPSKQCSLGLCRFPTWNRYDQIFYCVQNEQTKH